MTFDLVGEPRWLQLSHSDQRRRLLEVVSNDSPQRHFSSRKWFAAGHLLGATAVVLAPGRGEGPRCGGAWKVLMAAAPFLRSLGGAAPKTSSMENVILFSAEDAVYPVPQACLGAMILGAIGSCMCCSSCCCQPCPEGNDNCNGCCGTCCQDFLSLCAGFVGLTRGGVAIWTLAGIYQATLGQLGALATLSLWQALLASGCGLLGGVTLTGAAAAAGYAFCQSYNAACHGCLGDLLAPTS